MSPCDSEKSEIQPNLASGRAMQTTCFPQWSSATVLRGPWLTWSCYCWRNACGVLRSIGVVELASIGRMVQQR